MTGSVGSFLLNAMVCSSQIIYYPNSSTKKREAQVGRDARIAPQKPARIAPQNPLFTFS
jgi:hypothetical protein